MKVYESMVNDNAAFGYRHVIKLTSPSALNSRRNLRSRDAEAY